ncbi:MAG: NAD(P)/FAD-dependent oxidoreductase [Acidobacteriota bacterium]|nr:NAD(P)/FAD-dependent oxidoreductase [Acidobacteriota bacterium]
MRVVIIGAGPAGLTVAETLREYDRKAEIVLLSSEPFAPYAPPAMADHFLTGRNETLFWKGEDVCGRLGVDHRANVRVTRVRPASRQIVLDGGETLDYHRLVIASGSSLYAPLPGRDLPGVYDFKSLTAARALVERGKSKAGGKAVIVGAGFIGVEIAILLRELGLAVTMVEMADRVMPSMLDSETAEIVLAAMRELGIDVRLETKATGFTGKRKATGVALESGSGIKADVYVAATGVKPHIEFLGGSGIDAKWGVLVDDHLRTSVPDVYAAGDVAETFDLLTGKRYVHAIFPNAVTQARVVAMNLLGYDTVYPGSETMNSLKHLGLPVMAVGAMKGEEELRSRHGNVTRKIFLSDGRIVGFRLAGDISAAGVYRSLMIRRADVRAIGKHLLDPHFSAGALALEAAAARLDLRFAA